MARVVAMARAVARVAGGAVARVAGRCAGQRGQRGRVARLLGSARHPAGPVTDRGSASVLVLGLSAVIAVAVVAAAVRGVAVVDRHRVEAAADLAALAGAQSVLEGAGEACAQAASIARANGARLVRCALSGDVIEVEVASDLRLGRLGTWVVTGRARAGPATGQPPAP